MSKRFAMLSAAAVGALLIAGSAAVPALAKDKEKTVQVGGAPMYPSKTIVDNAVNSKDHTTLVAAVKAAGLVDTLSESGTVHGFRADQRGIRQAAERHRRNAGEA